MRLARIAVGWLIGLAVLVYSALLFRSMVASVPHSKAFGSVFIANGWLTVTLSLVGAVVALLAYSLIYTSLANRSRGRTRTPWPLFRQSVTHLGLWILMRS